MLHFAILSGDVAKAVTEAPKLASPSLAGSL
jgi:hypothetical protein